MISRTLLLLLCLFTCAAQAQTPQALNYQAVARDATGAVLMNQTISVRLSVLTGSSSGATSYQEIHNAVTTNAFGLFTVQVGNGTPAVGTFPAVDWGNGAKFLKVEADFTGGSVYTDMGTSQLLSVPYALFAKDVENDSDEQTLSISGNTVAISNGNTITLPTGVQTLNDLSDVNTSGASNNQVLQWNGSNWVPATVSGGVGDNWGTQTVVADAPLTGNGTAASHLKLTNGTATGQVLRWNGTAWIAGTDADVQTLSLSGNSLSISGGNSVTIPTNTDAQTLSIAGTTLTISGGNSVTLPSSTGDNWGTQAATTNATLTGNGTAASPLGIAAQGATSGQVLKWNGTTWAPANDIGGGTGDNWGTQTAATGTTLTGNGTAGSPLNLAQQSATSGQVLKWNGTTWAPTADNNTDAQTLSLAGSSLSISGGNNVTLPTGTTYTPGTGIGIAGNVISNTGDLSISNEIQSLSLAGTTLSISSGNSVTLPTGTTYAAGSGIDITGNTISATDNSATNEIQTLSLAAGTLSLSNGGGNAVLPDASATNEIQTLTLVGNDLSLSSGGGSVTLPAGGGLTLPYADTIASFINAFDVANSDYGAAISGTSQGDGVRGISSGSNGNGVRASADVGPYAYGVWGTSNSGYGVVGEGAVHGVAGFSNSASPAGLSSFGEEGYPGGTFASSTGRGLYSLSNGYDDYGGGTYSIGAYTAGQGNSNYSYGLYGHGTNGSENVGVMGVAYNGPNNYGVKAMAVPTGTGLGTYSVGLYASAGNTPFGISYAGYFEGDVEVIGSVAKSGGTFKIDHPLDPANKFLYHSFVESPDMMNIYNGNIITDANGEASVELPSYFEAENKDFRYQLTVIGQFAQAMVSQKISANAFKIKTDKPNVEVSWQVTGIRNDPWAQQNRVVPEVEKQGYDKGKYLYPALYGQPESAGIGQRMQHVPRPDANSVTTNIPRLKSSLKK